MCGIVGILARNRHVPANVLERATESLAHRGPDDSGTTTIRQTAPSQAFEVGLGARRLAILDLTPFGHQPMQDPATGNWIVYNGEIYNFRLVREKLRQRDVSFVSNSDTEVILKAYGYWGQECLKHLRGIFAFAIWDAQRQSLFLARDPMGVKPLYYHHSENHFLFASEVRTLLGTGLVGRRVDPAGLIHYLGFGSVYDPTTVIEGVAGLRPGHFLVWKDGTVRDEEYWDLIDESSGTIRQLEINSQAARRNAAAETAQQLRDAVSLQLVSDVPVGVFLSGGIDSSSLVALLSSGGTRASTFSLVFREDEFNEAEFSRAVAQRFHSDHHEISLSQQDALVAIPEALRAMDQPSMDGLNTYVIAQQARAAGVKVALSGLGGDEIFAGYSSFRTVVQMEKFVHCWHFLPAALRRPLSSALDLLVPASDANRKLFALAHENGSLVHPYFLSRALFTRHLRARIYPSASEQAEQRANASLRQALDRTQTLDPVNRVSYLEARCYMLNTLLRDSDVMSMAHGVEVRVPFLDPLLVRKILSLPGSWKLEAEVPKPLLVGALANALPDQIVRRKKRGFTLPFKHWLRDELRGNIESTLRKIPEGPLGEILSANAVQCVWQDFLRGNTSWSRPWSLYVLQRWSEINLC